MMEDKYWPVFPFSGNASRPGIIITIFLACGLSALTVSLVKWGTPKNAQKTPQRNSKPITWRIRGIPMDVQKESFRAHMEGSFTRIDQHTHPSRNIILELSLAKSTPQSQCATVTSLFPPEYFYCKYEKDLDFLGITPLFEPDSTAAKDVVDIVAVPGLGSHAWGSFRSTKDWRAWLRDFLPRDVPKARVLLYGYDTKLAKSTSKSSILDLAKSFLAAIKTFRGDTDTTKRPIIFIGHSLGGLLIKEALALANKDRASEESYNLFTSTYGLIFFGVPNLGLRNEQLCQLVDGQPNKRLLECLVTDKDSEPSDYLSELRRKFIETCEAQVPEFEIVSYYERRESPTVQLSPDGRLIKDGPLALLVAQQSACQIGLRESFHESWPLERDHSGLVKFNSLYDHEYSLVKSKLIDLVGRALRVVGGRFNEKKVLTPEQGRIWSDFNQPPYSDLQEKSDLISRPEPGTLEWLVTGESMLVDQGPEPWLRETPDSSIRREDFISWRNSPRSGSLLILAPPGQGKSVLSKYIIGHLQNQVSKTSKIIYYFCSIHYSEEHRNAESVLRALIVQLCEDQRIFRQLPPSFEKETKKFFVADFTTLWHIFEKALRGAPFERVYCVIDGLDVYGSRMDDLAARLRDIFNPNDLLNKPSLKLLCTSRDEEGIRSAFEGSAIRRFLPDRNDINIFIERRSAYLKKFSREMQETVKKELHDKAGQTFLWMDVVIRSLQELKYPSKEIIKEAIQKAPEKLPELYRLRVEAINTDWDDYRILMWVVYAKEPLSLAVLGDVVAFDPNSKLRYYSELEGRRTEFTADMIRSSLGTLRDVVEGKVYLIHQSLKDFFEESGALMVSPYTMREPRLQIASVCMCYLALDDFACEIAVKELLEDSGRREQRYPLLHYAARYWFAHIEASNEIDEVDLLQKILQPQEPNSRLWIEIAGPWSFFLGLPQGPSEVAIEFDIDWLAVQILEDQKELWTEETDQFNVDCLRKARKDSTEVLRVLLTHKQTRNFEVTEEVIKNAAAAIRTKGEAALSLLLRHREDGIKITSATLEVAARNPSLEKETIELLLSRDASAQITNEVVKAAAGNEWNGEEVMEVLLSHDANIQITEEVVKAAAGNDVIGEGVMEVILSHDANIQITEEVVKAAAGNKWRGKEVMEVLFSCGANIQITEDVAKTMSS